MKKRHRPWLLLAPALLLLLAAMGLPAHAQIDPYRSSAGIYQSSAGTPPQLVGEIYREGTDPTRYVEHWVLYPAYVYPSGTNGVTTGIRMGLHAYRDVNDFFARVLFSRGSRYVRVDCSDSDVRPTAP